MNINDHIYFAPGVLLKDLVIDDKEALINAFDLRIKNYYLTPLDELNKLKSAFSASIMGFSLIDAFARYSTNSNAVGARIKKILMDEFSATTLSAEKAYCDFRNGLLHESHIKNSGQLCYETSDTFTMKKGCLIINPLEFQHALVRYFNKFISSLKEDTDLYEKFHSRIKKDFEKEIEFFKNL